MGEKIKKKKRSRKPQILSNNGVRYKQEDGGFIMP